MGLHTRSFDFLRENLFEPSYGGSDITQKKGVDMIVAVRDAGTSEFGNPLVSLRGYWIGSLSDSWTANDYVTSVMDAFATGKPIPRVDMIRSDSLSCDRATKDALLRNGAANGMTELSDGSEAMLFPVHLASPHYPSHVPRLQSEETDTMTFQSGAWLTYAEPVRELCDFSSDDLLGMVESAQSAERSLMRSLSQIDAQADAGMSYEDRRACRTEVLEAAGMLTRTELVAPESMTDLPDGFEVEGLVDYVRNDDDTYEGHMVPVETWCSDEAGDGYLAFANDQDMSLEAAEQALDEDQAVSYLRDVMIEDRVSDFTQQMRRAYPLERIRPVSLPLDDWAGEVSASQVEQLKQDAARLAERDGMDSPVETYTDDLGFEHVLVPGVFSEKGLVKLSDDRTRSDASLRMVMDVNDELADSVDMRAWSRRRAGTNKLKTIASQPAFCDPVSGIASSMVDELRQISESASSSRVRFASKRVSDQVEAVSQATIETTHEHGLTEIARVEPVVSLEEQGSIERTDEGPSL